MAIKGVTSISIGIDSAGDDVLAVGVIYASAAARILSEIEGVPVVITVTGPINALPQR